MAAEASAEESLRAMLEESQVLRREAKWMQARCCIDHDKLLFETTPHHLAVANEHASLSAAPMASAAAAGEPMNAAGKA